MPEHVLFVHAHPDDESISTGGTIATLIERGDSVTVLTCTRGERGEVIPADLEHLEGTEALAETRTEELAAAMRALGVTDQRFLGEADARWQGKPPRRYTDSGMRWGADGRAEPSAEVDERSLCAAPFAEVAADIAAVIVATAATAVVSYDAGGGYGHPDHMLAHDAALRAAEVMEVPFFAIEPAESRRPIAVRVDVTGVLDRKRDALLAHRTQLTVDGDGFTLSNGVRHPIATVERYSSAAAVDAGGPWRQTGMGARILTGILAAGIGLVVGAIAVVDHRFAPVVLGAPVWVGIIATLLIVAGLTAGLRLAFGSRVPSAVAGIAVLVAITALSTVSQGGSVLVAADPRGYLLTFGPVAILLVVLAWPSVVWRRPADGRDRIEARSDPKGTSHQ